MEKMEKTEKIEKKMNTNLKCVRGLLGIKIPHQHALKKRYNVSMNGNKIIITFVQNGDFKAVPMPIFVVKTHSNKNTTQNNHPQYFLGFDEQAKKLGLKNKDKVDFWFEKFELHISKSSS